MDDKDINQSGTEDETIAASAPDLGITPEDCLQIEGNDPCAIIIMGATGDLAARKLVPSLFNLYLKNGLPATFYILGCGRTKLSDQQFRDKLKNAMASIGKIASF